MAAETHSGLPAAPETIGAGLAGVESFDRILWTAGDRPAKEGLPATADPAADHTDDELTRRRADVERKHRRVIALLDQTGHDAVVLGLPESLAWFTAGGDLGSDLGSEAGPVLLFVNRTSRAVVTDNVQSARVFEEELAGLGFQLKERAWFDEPGRVVEELTHNKRALSDLGPRPSPWPRGVDALRALRTPLTPLERLNLRLLGRTLASAVEATCRNFHPGETEADVAGHLAHRLIREGVVPVDIRVAGDDRSLRYRQHRFKAEPIRRRATVTATGRRLGLCATLSRTVCFGPAGAEVRGRHGLAAMVDATCIYFSRPGEPAAEVLRRARRIFEKFNRPHEWTLDYPGHTLGYAAREAVFAPDSPLVFAADSALCWSPSVDDARSSDTVVIDARGYECVTAAQAWPMIDVAVKGFVIQRPGLLER